MALGGCFSPACVCVANWFITELNREQSFRLIGTKENQKQGTLANSAIQDLFLGEARFTNSAILSSSEPEGEINSSRVFAFAQLRTTRRTRINNCSLSEMQISTSDESSFITSTRLQLAAARVPLAYSSALSSSLPPPSSLPSSSSSPSSPPPFFFKALLGLFVL